MWVCVNNFALMQDWRAWECKSFMISHFSLSFFCLSLFLRWVYLGAVIYFCQSFENKSTQLQCWLRAAVHQRFFTVTHSFIHSCISPRVLLSATKLLALLEAFWGYLSIFEIQSWEEVKNVEMKRWHFHIGEVVMICFNTILANTQHRSREMEGKTQPVGHVLGESNLGGHHGSVAPHWNMKEFVRARSIVKWFVLS